MPGKTSFIPAIDTILNSAPSLIAVYNLQTGAYTYVNDTAEKILGFKKELFLQRGVAYISSLVHPDDLARIIAENEKALAIANKSKNKKKTDEKIVTFEYRIRHQNGSWRWLRTDGIIFDRDNKGNVLHIMNSSIDITEQKESAIQTHRTRELAVQRNIVLDKVSKLMMKSINHQIALGEIIQMLVPAIADYCRLALIDEHKEIKELAVTHKDPDKVTLTQNLFDTYIGNPNTTHGVQKILQTGKAELISHVDDKILKTVKNDPALVKIVKSLNLQSYMGVPLTVRGTVIGALTLSSAREERIYKKDDMLFAEELARRIALMLDNGRLYREALDEIEKRKEAEAVIREREEQYRRLIELSPMPIAIHSMGKLLYINEAAVRLIGAKNKEAVLGKSILQFVHPDYHELVKKRAEIIYSNKKPNTDIVEEKFVTIQGDTIYVEVASLLFHYEGKPAIQVLIRDITVQKEVEEELRRREERFRLLVQNSSDLINVFSKDGTILYQSPSVKKILGREPRDRVGQSIFDNSHIHPADVKH
jgi:PAS domain S-box-containing protein